MIVDAGGGTIDISSYSRNQKAEFEEIAAPQCLFITIFISKITNCIQGHFHGSVFVTIHAKRFLKSMSLLSS